jgi:hypothetical protein
MQNGFEVIISSGEKFARVWSDPEEERKLSFRETLIKRVSRFLVRG